MTSSTSSSADSRTSRAVTAIALTVVVGAAIIVLTAAAVAPDDVARFGSPALASIGVAGFGYLARHRLAQALAYALVAGVVGAVVAFACTVTSTQL